MKSIFVVVALLLTQLAMANNHEKLVIEGKFLAEKNVEYTVYEYSDCSHSNNILTETGSHFFSLKLEIGKDYLVEFTSSKGLTKMLYIRAIKKDYFLINVDFSTDFSAKMTYNPIKNSYDITRFTTDPGLIDKF